MRPRPQSARFAPPAPDQLAYSGAEVVQGGRMAPQRSPLNVDLIKLRSILRLIYRVRRQSHVPTGQSPQCVRCFEIAVMCHPSCTIPCMKKRATQQPAGAMTSRRPNQCGMAVTGTLAGNIYASQLWVLRFRNLAWRAPKWASGRSGGAAYWPEG
jgi:hypothetical protein